jgi:hypothetical protein
MSNADEGSILAVTLASQQGPLPTVEPAVVQLTFFFLARQASEQYNTDSQFLAHALRHVMVRLQTAQGLLGRDCLLPLKSFFMGAQPNKSPWKDVALNVFAARLVFAPCPVAGKPLLREP